MTKHNGCWYVRIRGNLYECLFGIQHTLFIDVNDKSRFLTVDNDFTIKDLIKNPFFIRKRI